MARRVFKYRVQHVPRVALLLPQGAKVLSVQSQDYGLCLWAEVDPDAKPEERHFYLAQTGDPLPPEGELVYIDTALLMGGALVVHVYEMVKVAQG